MNQIEYVYKHTDIIVMKDLKSCMLFNNEDNSE